MRKQIRLQPTMGFKYTPTEVYGANVLKNLQPAEASLIENREPEAKQVEALSYDLDVRQRLYGAKKYIRGTGHVYLIATEDLLFSILLNEDGTYSTETIETYSTPYNRVSLLPLFSFEPAIFPVLVCKNGLTSTNEIYYFKNGSWLTGGQPNKMSITLPTPASPYVLLSSIGKHEPVEYRYTITYSNDYIESAAAPTIRFLGHRTPADMPTQKIGLYASENLAQGTGLTVNIYRWTSVINAWIKIDSFPYTNNWYYEDTKSADYIGSFVSPPFGTDSAIATDAVEDACLFADRIYLAVGDVLKVSRVNKFIFTPEPITAEDVGYIRLPYRITNLFVWGNHILALTDSGWYRIVENEGFLISLPVDLPRPANRDWIKEVEHGIVVVQSDCVYLIDRNENIQRVGNIDWERVFRPDRGVGREPLRITTYEKSGRRYLNIAYPIFRDAGFLEQDDDLGFECIRVDLETGSVFINTRLIPILKIN